MDIEELALRMRERAIKLDKGLSQKEIDERVRRLGEIELMQRLYFNAGRYVGGARDRTAKEAYERIAHAAN